MLHQAQRAGPPGGRDSHRPSRSVRENGCLYFLLGVVRIFSKFGAGCIFFQYLVTNLFSMVRARAVCIFLVIFFELFVTSMDIPKPNSAENKRSLARKQSTGAHLSFRRDSTQRSLHGAGGTRRTRAPRAAGSRQSAGLAARHKKVGCSRGSATTRSQRRYDARRRGM